MVDKIGVKTVMKIMLDDGAKMPTRAHEYDAGMDLYTPKRLVIRPHDSVVVDTGVHVEIPERCVGMLKSKSGLNVKDGIQSEGVIDAGYTGSIVAKLYNNSDQMKIFNKGDKITQLVIMPVLLLELELVTEFEETERGNNGFGSSGK